MRVSLFKRKSLFGKQTLADAGYGASAAPERHPLLEFVLQIGGIALLFGRTVGLLFRARTDRGDSWRMAYRYTNQSLLFIVVAMGFVGMIMVYQSTTQLNRALGDTTLVGASFLKLLVRVLGPTVIGMLMACRVGAGIAAELGAMAVTEQIDAMRLCAAQPLDVLMVPRLRGAIVAGIALTIIGSTAAALSGAATAQMLFSVSGTTYWNLDLIGLQDVLEGLTKACLYGFAVPIVSGMYGLAAKGGAAGVGDATTRAVVGSSFTVIVLDSVVSFLGYAVTGV